MVCCPIIATLLTHCNYWISPLAFQFCITAIHKVKCNKTISTVLCCLYDKKRPNKTVPVGPLSDVYAAGSVVSSTTGASVGSASSSSGLYARL